MFERAFCLLFINHTGRKKPALIIAQCSVCGMSLRDTVFSAFHGISVVTPISHRIVDTELQALRRTTPGPGAAARRRRPALAHAGSMPPHTPAP